MFEHCLWFFMVLFWTLHRNNRHFLSQLCVVHPVSPPPDNTPHTCIFFHHLFMEICLIYIFFSATFQVSWQFHGNELISLLPSSLKYNEKSSWPWLSFKPDALCCCWGKKKQKKNINSSKNEPKCCIWKCLKIRLPKMSERTGHGHWKKEIIFTQRTTRLRFCFFRFP